jgi:hypothetical protein
MVWSIKVIATAKIIAVRIRLRDWPPPVLLLTSTAAGTLVEVIDGRHHVTLSAALLARLGTGPAS